MKKLITTICLLLLVATICQADTLYRTTNGTKSWWDASSWSPNKIPAYNDIIHINVPNYCDINDPNNMAICAYLFVGETIDPFGTLNIRSPFICTGNVKIGSGGVIAVYGGIECIIGGETYVSYPDVYGGGGSLLLCNKKSIWRAVGGTKVGYNGTIGGVMENVYGILKTPNLHLDSGSHVNCIVEWP